MKRLTGYILAAIIVLTIWYTSANGDINASSGLDDVPTENPNAANMVASANGNINASSGLDNAPTEKPSTANTVANATLEPTMNPTSVPTAIPVTVAAPKLTEKPESKPTKNLATTVKPTQKPVATPVATKKPTPKPTTTPKPTITPKPTATPKPTTHVQSVEFLSAVEDRVVSMVNSEREKAGVSPLEKDSILVKTARYKSEEMGVHNYFAHKSPVTGYQGWDIAEKIFGFKRNGSFGENIWKLCMKEGTLEKYPDYYDTFKAYVTAEKMMDSWMNSEGHKKNILNPDYKRIGVGVAVFSDLNSYATQVFSE